MKDLGYSVHGIGKWHLGMCSYDYTPIKRGFDTFYGLYNGAGDYYSKTMNSRLVPDGGYDFRYQMLSHKTHCVFKFGARIRVLGTSALLRMILLHPIKY